jgi:sulfur-oxidizing protein SoxY
MTFSSHRFSQEIPMNTTRRDAIKTTGAFATLVSLGLITQAQANAAVTHDSFHAIKTLEDALKAIGGTAASSDQVSVVSPDIAENGAVVPVSVETDIANPESITIVAEKNPTPLTASFLLGAGAEGFVSTRIKMGQTSNVVAVVKSNGKIYSAGKEVKVTIGGCGG